MLTDLIHNKNRARELNAALRAINKSLTTKELFTASLNQTLQFFGAERGSILLFNLANKELSLKIVRGQEEDLSTLGNTKQKIGEGISGIVAQEKKPLLVKNIHKDLRFKSYQNRLNHYKTNSFLSVPLFVQDTLIGVINITDKSSRHSFCKEDLDYLSIISNQISSMFEKIKLQDAIKIKAAQNAKLSVENIELRKELSLAKKFASLGKISSGIAHEINNPLDGIIRYTNLCMERTKEEKSKEYLTDIKSGLGRIANIVRSLLGFSRYNTDTKSTIDINQAIDESLSLINHANTNNNITIIKNYCPDMPKVFDKGIKHIFMNLIKNAFEAMDKDGGTLTIYTGRTDGAMQIKISDTGCGIPSENRLKIFDPFFTTKGFSEGVGLGLAICYDIIERYNGKITLESGADKGTTFVITIPV